MPVPYRTRESQDGAYVGRPQTTVEGMEPDRSAVGLTGTLVIATRGTRGPGEVLVSIRGGSETYLAWSEDALPVGSTVLLVDARGNRTVDVVAWTGPVGIPE